MLGSKGGVRWCVGVREGVAFGVCVCWGKRVGGVVCVLE